MILVPVDATVTMVVGRAESFPLVTSFEKVSNWFDSELQHEFCLLTMAPFTCCLTMMLALVACRHNQDDATVDSQWWTADLPLSSCQKVRSFASAKLF
jgi:hypothetical protein